MDENQLHVDDHDGKPAALIGTARPAAASASTWTDGAAPKASAARNARYPSNEGDTLASGQLEPKGYVTGGGEGERLCTLRHLAHH